MYGRLRCALRLVHVGAHLVVGMTLAAICCLFSKEVHLPVKRWWSARLVGALGVRLDVHAPRDHGGTDTGRLIAANHNSWLDVFLLNAVMPSAFVCKAEVRAWPLVGWLCARTGTVFIKRGSRRDAQRTRRSIAENLKAGRAVAAFPEGTTNEGNGLLPFRPALFQAAIDAGSDVHPVALRYLDENGQRTSAAANVGDTTLWHSLIRISSARRIVARVEFLPPVLTGGRERRDLCRSVEEAIASALNQPEGLHRAGDTGIRRTASAFSGGQACPAE